MTQTSYPLDVRDARRGSPSAAGDRRSVPRWALPAAAVAVTVLVAASRVLWNPWFYFYDDTQSGTVGQWYALGQRLLAGEWPMLDPHAWTAGNYFAEGQWGLYSPLTWLISVVATLGFDLAVLATVVKVAALGIMTLGVHLLARSFGATPMWAAAAGVLAPLSGFTVYMDAASWTTGLFGSALFPWVWWGLRRVVEEDRSPLPFLVASASIVTLGYVFPVLFVVLILVESLVRHAVRRDWVRAVRTLAASVYSGLLTVTVFLPGILTAPVTVRGTSEIANFGFLNADLGDLAASATATTTATIGAWGTGQFPGPLVYVAWIVPLFPLVLPIDRPTLRRLLPVLLFGAVTVLIVTGPSHLGPLRWPIRCMPYVVLAVVVVFAVAASRAFPHRLTRRRLMWSLALAGAMSWFSVVIVTSEWRRVLVGLIVLVVGILIVYAVGQWRNAPAWTAETRSNIAAAAVAAVGVALVLPQMVVFPGSPLPLLGGASSPAAMAAVLDADDPDDGIVVGDVLAVWMQPRAFEEILIGNQWYFSPVRVSSTYTVLPHEAYVTDLCADLRGSTCPAALGTLLSVDPTTERPVADLLGVNTMVAVNASFPGGFDGLPPGWGVSREGEFATVLSRTVPVATAGGVAWTGPGTQVEVLEQSDTRLELRVEAVGSDPRVVLSRLNWPGYSVEGAVFTDPVRGYLHTLDVSGAASGDTVVVQFRPPGWVVEIAALVLAIGMLVAWPVLRSPAARRLRLRYRASTSRHSSISPPS